MWRYHLERLEAYCQIIRKYKNRRGIKETFLVINKEHVFARLMLCLHLQLDRYGTGPAVDMMSEERLS